MLPTWMILLCLLPFGWLCGMLANYLADVLPGGDGLKILRCASCQAPQPLRYTLFWPGACPQCGRARARRVWVVLFLFTLAAPACWLYPMPGLNFGLALLVLLYFGVILVIDIEHHLILFVTSLFGLILGLLVGWQRVGLASSLGGGALSGLVFLGIYLLGIAFGKLLSRIRGRTISETVFGLGDIFLGTIAGLMLGLADAPRFLLYTILLAGAGSLLYLLYLVLMRRYHHLGTALPYAPFIITSTLLLLYSYPFYRQL